MKAAAFFDVDGTIVDSNIVRYYAFFKTRALPPLQKALWQASFIFELPYYWLLDQYSRTEFNRRFYKNYAGLSLSTLLDGSEELFTEVIKPRIFPQAVACIRRHQQQGHAVVLVTGSLDFVVRPLADFLRADSVCAAELEFRQGKATGSLAKGPVTDRVKGELTRNWIDERSLSRADCFAYADSWDDHHMLEAAGHAAAVNPDRRLSKRAAQKHWEILTWKRSNM